MSQIQQIYTANAPKPHGHYVQATVHNDVVYTAIQLGNSTYDEELIVGTIEQQTRQALTNLEAVLRAANSSLQKTIKITIYLADFNLWETVNEIYAEILQDHMPARVVVHCNNLYFGYQVGFEAIAAI